METVGKPIRNSWKQMMIHQFFQSLQGLGATESGKLDGWNGPEGECTVL